MKKLAQAKPSALLKPGALREPPAPRAGRLESALGGAIAPLPHRAAMESAFGEDFSGVRVFVGQRAALDG
ncbi:MAG TPA: hypothetical protein VK509_12310, partial [Polyangiales bacterium]|nr:hypothetical protein [Polyangiales bacterium]